MYNPADVRALMADPPALHPAKLAELESLGSGVHEVACADINEYVAIQDWCLKNKKWPTGYTDTTFIVSVD